MIRAVLWLEPVSKISSAPLDDMRAATSFNFGEEVLGVSQRIHLRFFPRFPRLASHLANLASKLFLIPVLVILCLGISTNGVAQRAPDALNYAPVEYRSKDQRGFEVDLSATVTSNFLFRGRQLYDGLSLQPSLQPSYSFGKYGNLSGMLWFLSPLEGDKDSDSYFIADQGLSYDYTYSRFTFSIGQYWYGFPQRAQSVNSTSELWGALSLDTIFSPTFTVYWDYDAFDSLYYEITLSHTFRQSGPGAFNLTLFSRLGFASHAELLYQHGGLVQTTSGISTDIRYGALILRPLLAYTASEDGAATNKVWGGVSLVVEL